MKGRSLRPLPCSILSSMRLELTSEIFTLNPGWSGSARQEGIVTTHAKQRGGSFSIALMAAPGAVPHVFSRPMKGVGGRAERDHGGGNAAVADRIPGKIPLSRNRSRPRGKCVRWEIPVTWRVLLRRATCCQPPEQYVQPPSCARFSPHTPDGMIVIPGTIFAAHSFAASSAVTPALLASILLKPCSA